jgi:hypothetical protein
VEKVKVCEYFLKALYEGNACQHFPDAILAVEGPPDMWQSSSMVSLSLLNARM